MALNAGNVSGWSLRLRRAADSIAMMFMQAYMLARKRAAESPSPVVRTLAARDEESWKLAIREREIALFRMRLEAMPVRKRPKFAPEDRFEILQLMRLQGLSLDQAAKRYVLHPNTLWGWTKKFRTNRDVGALFGKPPFNRIADAARWVVHEIRRLCPEKEFGTRSIAMAVVRAGIKLSRSSVQRILREKKPPAPAAENAVSPDKESAKKPCHILRPKTSNRTWHLDLMTFDFFWRRFYVAAVLDGFSRKLMSLRVFRDAPSSMKLWKFLKRCMADFATPRFLVTDHGCQFKGWFKRLVEGQGTTLVKGRKRAATLNGKAERVIKSLRFWQRLTLFAWKIEWIQRKLNTYRAWYNGSRPMWILGGRTPDEVYAGREEIPAAEPCRVGDPAITNISVRRIHPEGDRHLPVLEILWSRVGRRCA